MKKRVVFFIWPLTLLVALFIDTLTPIGFADFFFYSGILIFFIYSNKKYIVLAGITSIVFIIVGYLLSPNDFSVPASIAISNRILGIGLVVFIVYIMVKFSKRGIELLKKINELENANRELEAFNFISSHDLQEPLRKMQIFVSVLNKEKNISDDGKLYLEKLDKTSKQMRMFLEDLLKYSSITKIEHQFEKVKLKTVFDEVIATYKESNADLATRIQIEGDCEANIVPALFRQVIDNLILNSLKFSHPDRELQINIKSEIYTNSSISELSPNLDYCHITVADNGIGFDSQYNEYIFEFFKRLHGEKYQGTGLGLAICRKIVETHNGIIKANGELNKGAQFDIYIPSYQNKIKL